MNKKLMIILTLVGYTGTTQTMAFLAIKAMSNNKEKARLMAPGQTVKYKHEKKYKLVSKNPHVASVKKVDDKTSLVTAHHFGTVFIAKQDKNSFSNRFIAGIQKSDKGHHHKKKGNHKDKKHKDDKKHHGKKHHEKGFFINVAEKHLKKNVWMKEDDIKYFKIKMGEEYHQDNKHDDKAASVSTKHLILKDENGKKYKILKVKALDEGESPAIVVNKKGNETIKFHIKERDEK